MKRTIPNWLWVIIAASSVAFLLAATHATDRSIVSFDEGFHGGAALFVVELVRWVLHGGHFARPTYLIGEYANGLTLYPPLWTAVASVIGLMFKPSVGAFRAASSVFYVLAVFWTYWFAKRATSKELVGITCAILLGTVPMVMIYSHLMMLEVPLLLGISSMVGLFYLSAMDLLPRNRWAVVGFALIFAAGSLTKVAALPVFLMVAGGFAVISSIVFWRQKFYRRFLKPELAVYVAAAIVSLLVFVKAEEIVLHANALSFHEQQTQGGSTANPLVHALSILWYERDFYLRDFKHMPLISWIWFGSIAVYLIWKRTPLSVLLAVWTFGIYCAFSSVRPQVPQYISSIYAPLAIATGLVLNEIAERIPVTRLRIPLAVTLVGIMAILQVIATPQSEGYQWRTVTTGQVAAAKAIADSARPGDAVLTWHDGDTLVVRMASFDKELQITNAIVPICGQAEADTFSWAIVSNQPPGPNPEDMTNLGSTPWSKFSDYGNGATSVYHNPAAGFPLTIWPAEMYPSRAVSDAAAAHGKGAVFSGNEPMQPSFWGCYRQYPLGNLAITYRVRAEGIDSLPAGSVLGKLEYSATAPGGDYASRPVTLEDLKDGAYHDLVLTVTKGRLNRQGEIKLYVNDPNVRLVVDRIDVQAK